MHHASLSLRTTRLRLDPLAPADAEDLFRVYGNPETWQHMPTGRFTRVEQARELITASEQSFRDHGLGTWAIRIDETGADESLICGQFIGSGGARYLDGGKVWNLGYRLDPSAWRRGFATEVSLATMDAAAATAPQIPFTGRVLTNNPGSIAVLEKIGLSLIWEGTSADAPPQRESDAPILRRIYADRELDAAAYDWLVAHA